jgi:Fe-S oxidoreductase
MQVALMVPCYIDMFNLDVGIATLELLQKLGVDVVSMCKICSSFRQQNTLNMEM